MKNKQSIFNENKHLEYTFNPRSQSVVETGEETNLMAEQGTSVRTSLVLPKKRIKRDRHENP